jgi:hypothetical protein
MRTGQKGICCLHSLSQRDEQGENLPYSILFVFLVLLQGRTVFADQAGNHPGGAQAE